MFKLLLQYGFEIMGLDESEITNIFKIVSSILKLGNLNMVPTNNIDGTEGCIITNDYGKYLYVYTENVLLLVILT